MCTLVMLDRMHEVCAFETPPPKVCSHLFFCVCVCPCVCTHGLTWDVCVHATRTPSAARASNQTSSAYVQRADGTYALPTDARGVAGMLGNITSGTVFRDTLLLTQLAQATCVKTEAESYRRLQSDCVGGGCTMLSLYWMADDLWPAATKVLVGSGARAILCEGRVWVVRPRLCQQVVLIHDMMKT